MSSFNGIARIASSPDNWVVDGANNGRVHNTLTSVASRFSTSNDPNIPSSASAINVTGYFSMVAADTDGGASCLLEVLDNLGNTLAASNVAIAEGSGPDFTDFREYSCSAGGLSPSQCTGLRLQATNGTTGGGANRRIRWDVQGDNLFLLTFTLAVPTSVITTAATNITGSQAQLNGTFNPAGANASWPCYYRFEWGLTPAYGNLTDVVGGNIGSGTINASAVITGLNSNTIYHYRIVVFNNDNSSVGSDMTFTSGATYTLTLTDAISEDDTIATLGAGTFVGLETISLSEDFATLLSLAPSVINLELQFATVIDIDAYF